jgi:hypothetical protein
VTYFFAFAHKEAECFFVGAFKRGMVKSEDIAGDDDEQSARKYNYDTLR